MMTHEQSSLLLYTWHQEATIKLCLRLDPHSIASGASTHVSVYVHLMKGENDHQLQRPFQHLVTYRILNWTKDANHNIDTIYFKNASAQANVRVTSGDRAPTGPGHPKALPHNLVFDCKDKDVFTKIVCACKS